MAEKPDKPAEPKKADVKTQAAPTGTEAATDKQPAGQRQIQIDDSKAVTKYANVFLVSPGQGELILHFGLMTQPVGQSNQPLVIDQRIILNYFVAKRLSATLQSAVEQYEKLLSASDRELQRQTTARAAGTGPLK